MVSKIIMPQGGQDLTTGRIVRWLKKEDDTVREGEVICEVETEKAVFEVSSPQDGYLLKITAVDGQEVEILSVIGYVGEKGEMILIGDEKTDNENREQASIIRDSVHQEPDETPRPKIIISPKARKLAKDNQIPLTSLKSRRLDGKITFNDVLIFIKDQVEKAVLSGEKVVDGRIVHPDKMRRTIARRLTESWQSTPHIFVTVSVDMTGIVQRRISQNNMSVSINDFILFACAQAIAKFKDINATFHDEDTLYYWEDINIGLAVSTENGLMVPVIEDADQLTLEEIALRSKGIAEKARAGLQTAKKPSRFTISNLGMYNVDAFTAIINPPETAILAVSSIRKIPVVLGDGQIVARDLMNITLSLDHRVGDGVLAAGFVNEVKKMLEEM